MIQLLRGVRLDKIKKIIVHDVSFEAENKRTKEGLMEWLRDPEKVVAFTNADITLIECEEGEEMTEYETEKVEDLVRGMTDEEIRVAYRAARDEMERRGLEE